MWRVIPHQIMDCRSKAGLLTLRTPRGAMTKKFCISALFAFLLILLVVGVRPPAVAADQDDIQKNVIDLRTAKFFSRPVTELELIVLNLKAQAKQSAHFVGASSNLHLIKTLGNEPDGDAGFDPTTGRIVLALSLDVSEMSDPWKDTCDSTIRSFYGWFYLPQDSMDQDVKLSLMAKYLGEAVRIDKDDAVDAIDILLHSMVTRIIFHVLDNTSSPLMWLRTCTKDDLSGKIFYTEHRLK
jgi:hypothetical protein